MLIPGRIDKTPDGFIVPPVELFEEGSGENIEFQASIAWIENGFLLDYHGEDGTLLDDNEIIDALNIVNKDLNIVSL